MRAVLPEFDPDHRPVVGGLPDPTPGPGELLIAVEACALNRVDLMQARGHYPPPPGESTVPGLEAAGTVAALGGGVSGWQPGERVMALLAGGGQAELVAAPVGQVMRLPGNLSFTQGAAIPEVGLTAWTNLVAEGRLQAGESVLITGASSGVGSFAVQLARELGARVIAAGRSRQRLERLTPLGADALVTLSDDLAARVREANGGAGVDLVLDLVGGRWLPAAIECLSRRGRLVLVGLMAGSEADLDLRRVLSRRLSIIGSVLRSRSRAEKAELVAGFADFCLPRLAEGRLEAVVDRVMELDQAAAAYQAMERGGHLGKIVLRVGN